jgi:NAD(P)-dependent dehydrogenase (short-subunit alcohol dehydrogenase family)
MPRAAFASTLWRPASSKRRCMGEIDEIVDAILYLERAGLMTGETINVDGGQHAGRW